MMVGQRWILWSLERVLWLVAERDRLAQRQPSLAAQYDKELIALCELLEAIADSRSDLRDDALALPPTVSTDYPLPPAPQWAGEASAVETLETAEDHPVASPSGQSGPDLLTLTDMPAAETYAGPTRSEVGRRWLIPMAVLALNVAAVAAYVHWSRAQPLATTKTKPSVNARLEATRPAQQPAPAPTPASMEPQSPPPPPPASLPPHHSEHPKPQRRKHKHKRRTRRSLKLGDSTDPLGGI